MSWGFTIFAMPHAFEGDTAIRQENAIKTWKLLKPEPEIILIGDETEVREAAHSLGCYRVPDVRRNEFGTPLVASIFFMGQDAAWYDHICYVNSDVMLLGLGRAIKVCADAFDQFLMIGRRWDLDVPFQWKLTPDWQSQLRTVVKQRGKLHSVGALDYFAFRRGLYRNIPDFAIGRSAWDNWMVSHVVQRNIPVIDATEVVLAVHQEHSSSPMTKARAKERKRNRMFYDRDRHGVTGTTKNANWTLTKCGLAKRR